MDAQHSPIETQARQQIAERISRAASPRLALAPRRHRLAARLRRVADRLES